MIIIIIMMMMMMIIIIITLLWNLRFERFSLPGKLPMGASTNKFLKVPKEPLRLSIQIDKTFRNGPAVPNRVAFWITSSLMVTLSFPTYFSNVTAPNAPITYN